MEALSFLPDVVALHPQMLAATNPINILILNELTIVKLSFVSWESL